MCLLVLTSFLGSLALLGVSGAPQASATTYLRVNPGNVSANLYSNVSISIVIENVANMYGYEFRLLWDTSILRAVQFNYTSGKPYAGSNPSTPPWTAAYEAVNNVSVIQDGKSRYWLSLVSMETTPKSGTFSVATLTFNVVGVGTTPLTLTDTTLGDPMAQPIPHTIVSGSLVTIVHDVAINHVTPLSSTIIQGNSIEIIVETENLGNVPDSFTVGAYYNSTTTGVILLAGQTAVTNLAAFTALNVSIPWETTGVDVGRYQIFANASHVESELNVTNNIYVDGFVEVATEFVHDVAIDSLAANATTLVQDEMGALTVAVKNKGWQNENNVALTVFVNEAKFGDATLSQVFAGSTQIFVFNWSTVGKLGDFVIKANVSLPGDVNLTNNVRTMNLTVTKAPVANFTASLTEVGVNHAVAFDASASADSDGQIANYTWDFGDSTYYGHSKLVTHRYTKPGNYTARLTVTDNKGLTYIQGRPLTNPCRLELNITVKAASASIVSEDFVYVGAIVAAIIVLVAVLYLKVLRKM